MYETRIRVEEGQRLTLVEMAADVAITGGSAADVLVRLRDGREGDLTVEQLEGGPAISARCACDLEVPAGLPVTVRQGRGNLLAGEIAELNAEQVRGNLKLSGLRAAVVAEVYGNLKAAEVASLKVVGTVYGNAEVKEGESLDLQNVRGNLAVKELKQVRVSRVSGNLAAKEIGQTLQIDQVGGNAEVKEVGGAVTIEQVAGNMAAKKLGGGAKVGRIGANLAFRGSIGDGCTYQFKVDGNAALSLPEGTGAHLALTAGGHIVCSLKLADELRERHKLVGTLGDGGAEIAVETLGHIDISGDQGEVGATLGEEISRQVEESLGAIDLEAIGRKASAEMGQGLARLRVKLEGMDWERVGQRTHHAVERAMERLQHEVERTAERTARQQERLERIAEREAQRVERLQQRWRRVEAAPDEPPAGPEAATVEIASSSEETVPQAEEVVESEATLSLDRERLAVLKMLEQGQITPAEAEMLLNALE